MIPRLYTSSNWCCTIYNFKVLVVLVMKYAANPRIFSCNIYSLNIVVFEKCLFGVYIEHASKYLFFYRIITKCVFVKVLPESYYLHKMGRNGIFYLLIACASYIINFYNTRNRSLIARNHPNS